MSRIEKCGQTHYHSLKTQQHSNSECEAKEQAVLVQPGFVMSNNSGSEREEDLSWEREAEFDQESIPEGATSHTHDSGHNFFKIRPWFTLSFFAIALSIAAWNTSVRWTALSSFTTFSLSRANNQVYIVDDISTPLNTTSKDGPSGGTTSEVQWDKYSLIVKGQRIFLHSGEFHTFRLPVPSLWPDILQKIKAAGFNAISVYTHWGLINPSPGVVDFDGFRALQPLYDACKDAGLWIVVRPGPYINAETSAGGMAHWATSEVADSLRTNATDFYDAWLPYIQGIINVTVHNQVSHGGPVIAIQIDNEFSDDRETRRLYFQQLEEVYRKGDIVVPLTYNDPGMRRNFVNGTGSVDIYGFDEYPQRFDCSNPQTWLPVITNYYDYHMNTNPGQPLYVPEFQAGAYDAWGPTAPGYGSCGILTGPSFQDVFYKGLWAANAKMINYYMIYGGTSWGGIPFHGVYTSYDYGSAISENRELNAKYDDLKRQGLFIRSSPEFYKTEWMGNSTSDVVKVTNPSVLVVYLSNPETGAGFYIARNNISSSTDGLDFKVDVKTSEGIFTVPQMGHVTLGGRQSKLIVTDYAFGDTRALYSTAQVLFAGKIGLRDVLFLFGDATQEHEIALTLPEKARMKATDHRVVLKTSAGRTVINLLSGIKGLVTLWDSDSHLILFGDTDTAATFFAPTIPGSTGDSSTFKNYWQVGTNTTALVGGPYLVRNATISGSTLSLSGDLKTSVFLTVITSPDIDTILWNGENVSFNVSASSSITEVGGFVGHLQTHPSLSVLDVPILSDWKFADSLPEVQSGFSDLSWVTANHTSTIIPYKPYYGDGRVLYGCDYGFCENIVLWRGHFQATGHEKYVNLSINGGEAFAASVWLNDRFLNTSYGNSTNNLNIIEETDDHFIFPPGVVIPGQDNVITVVQDNMGLNETDGETDNSRGPRGIRGFKLDSGHFGEWKVQGKLGGYIDYPDKVRGIFNEGGLFGEREGWHLPGFDTSSWQSRHLSDGVPDSAAGIGFFVTTFRLKIPDGLDVPMSFTFDESTQPYRALLFVNGWMMGKRVPNLGPQTKFPVHQGILDYNGENTVAVALWVMEPNVTISPKLELTIDGRYDGGVGGIVTNNPRWTQRSSV
ncbi:glycoside hydrolase family 35 protein [Rickenella mellea]|uniref:beta-galactosidase n=1 Tax=Rickenella mellea TaxID=50990 RepID=A0A4Y7Q647_9AGAM|nr:glycoside hydrolase family 35 protein [Rickenella mellea]